MKITKTGQFTVLESLLNTSVFVQILAFACASIVVINVVVGLVNLCLNIYIKLNRL
jgi:hypothetical protein